MSIWFIDYTPDTIHQWNRNMGKLLDITVTEIGDDYIVATMPVDERTQQPFGLLHGGASCVLAESIGSMASVMCLNPAEYSAVGIEINASHLRGVREGLVTAVARPFRLGRRTHVWHIEITDEAGKLVCVSRLTMAIIEN